MAKNEKKNAEKELEQVSGGFGGFGGVASPFELAKQQADYDALCRRNRKAEENAGKEAKHEISDSVQLGMNALKGKLW